nr:MAG TPA: hypothetical protein [Caudoviricetes sp.]
MILGCLPRLVSLCRNFPLGLFEQVINLCAGKQVF